MSWTSGDVGHKCKTASGKRGVVKWVGEGLFAPGTWVGVELDTPDGKHDGEVKGKRYFKCKSKHGVMLKPSQVKKLVAKPKGGKKAPKTSATKTGKTGKTGKTKAGPKGATGRKAGAGAKRGPGGAKKAPAAKAPRKVRTRPATAKGSARTPKAKAGNKGKGAKALAAKRTALAKAKAAKTKKAAPRSKAGKTAKAAKAKKPEPEMDANELLRQRIIAKLRGETVEPPPAGPEGADSPSETGDAPDLPAAPEGNKLKDRIAARLAAIRNDGGTTPPASPTRSAGSTAASTPASSPSKQISRSPEHVPAHKRCTTKDEVATLIQALCRGFLIRVEQFNLLDASVKLLRVEDNQWLVVGQGVAEVTDEVVPYVQVIGWKLEQRAWESTKALLYETPIRCGETLTREDDGLGPPIYILNDEYDDIVRGLEFALPGDEEAFEEMYAFARRDTAALRVQAVFRGARVRWGLKLKRGSDGKKARNPALPTPTATPDHHPPIGALIKVKRPMKKSKIGRLISYATFTGKYTIQYKNKTQEIDLDKVKYSRINDATDDVK